MKKIIIKLGYILKYPTVILIVLMSVFKDEFAKKHLLVPSGYLLLLFCIIIGLCLILEKIGKRKDEK